MDSLLAGSNDLYSGVTGMGGHLPRLRIQPVLLNYTFPVLQLGSPLPTKV